MYRPQIILARNISIEVPGQRSSPEIASANRDPSHSLQFFGIIWLMLYTVLGKSPAAIELAPEAVALQFAIVA